MNTEKSVLIIEDNPVDLIHAYHLIKGFYSNKVVCVESGNQAIEQLSKQHFEVILCDIDMSDGDGSDVLKFLSQYNKKNQCVFVWVSACPGRIIQSMHGIASSAGLENVQSISKPLSFSSLESLFATDFKLSYKNLEGDTCPSVLWSDEDWRSELQRALDNETIRVVYQPQYSIVENTIIGAESLARWYHSECGFISPEVFARKFDECGLGKYFMIYVVKKTVKLLKSLNVLGKIVPVSVNVSAPCLSDPSLPEELEKYMDFVGISNHFLKIELTEKVDTEKQLDFGVCLNRLAVKNFTLSVDDFGTGISGLKLLIDYPFKEIKVDRHFIQDIVKNENQQDLVASILKISKDFGLKVVVEGVEEEGQVDKLNKLGIDYIQGYWFSKPINESDFVELIKNNL